MFTIDELKPVVLDTIRSEVTKNLKHWRVWDTARHCNYTETSISRALYVPSQYGLPTHEPAAMVSAGPYYCDSSDIPYDLLMVATEELTENLARVHDNHIYNEVLKSHGTHFMRTIEVGSTEALSVGHAALVWRQWVQASRDADKRHWHPDLRFAVISRTVRDLLRSAYLIIQDTQGPSNPNPEPAPDTLGPNCYQGHLMGFRWRVDPTLEDPVLSREGWESRDVIDGINTAHPILSIFGVVNRSIMFQHAITKIHHTYDPTERRLTFHLDDRYVATVLPSRRMMLAKTLYRQIGSCSTPGPEELLVSRDLGWQRGLD